MARAGRRRGGSGTVKLPNLHDVDELGGICEEGEFLLEVKEVSSESGDKADYLKWTFEVIDDKKNEGRRVYHNTSFSPPSLPFLKKLLDCLEYEYPDEPSDLDPRELVGLTTMAEIYHDTYEGRKQAKIGEFLEAEAEPRGKSKTKGKDEDKETRRGRGKDKEEDEPRKRRSKRKEQVSEADIKEMSEDALEDFVKEYKLDVDLDDFPTLRKKVNAAIDAAEKEGVLAE